MFILRQKTFYPETPFERNMVLGNSYNIVWREGGGDEFDYLIKDSINPENIYGFILYNEGADCWPLYLKFAYYIMTADGRTFSNISYK